jgi:hypothetical protein
MNNHITHASLLSMTSMHTDLFLCISRHKSHVKYTVTLGIYQDQTFQTERRQYQSKNSQYKAAIYVTKIKIRHSKHKEGNIKVKIHNIMQLYMLLK